MGAFWGSDFLHSFLIAVFFAAKPHYDDEIVNAFFEESDFLIDR